MILNIKDIRDISNYNYIGRNIQSSIFGNPFVIGRDGTRDEVIEKFREYSLNTPKLLQAIAGLDLRPLVCHCSPQRCHGEIILELKELKELIQKNELIIPTSHKLAIVGSRSFSDYVLFKKYLEKVLEKFEIKIDNIISGGARGTDSLAKKFSEENNIEIIEILPDRKKFGNKACFLRNTDIILNSTYVIAFWDYLSTGTFDSICKAKDFNKEIKIIDTRKLK